MAFVPQGTTDGSDWHGKMREVNIPAGVANTFLGDMMTLFGGGAPASGRAENVALATPGDGNPAAASTTDLAGAVIEFTPDFTDEGSLIRNFHQTGAAQLAKLVYGSDVIYEAPDTLGTLLVADVNSNRNIATPGGESLFTGVSTMGIGLDPTAENEGQLRILTYTNLEGDTTQQIDIGTIGAVWRCRINWSSDDHRELAPTAGT